MSVPVAAWHAPAMAFHDEVRAFRDLASVQQLETWNRWVATWRSETNGMRPLR